VLAIDLSKPKGAEANLAPDPVQRKCSEPLALAVGGIATVLLEFADARMNHPRRPIRADSTGAHRTNGARRGLASTA
jgi:hypothetical protein